MKKPSRNVRADSPVMTAWRLSVPVPCGLAAAGVTGKLMTWPMTPWSQAIAGSLMGRTSTRADMGSRPQPLGGSRRPDLAAGDPQQTHGERQAQPQRLRGDELRPPGAVEQVLGHRRRRAS